MNNQHPRTQKAAMAKFEIERACVEIIVREGLTFVESVQALNATIASLAKDALRAERHPNDPDKPADIA